MNRAIDIPTNWNRNKQPFSLGFCIDWEAFFLFKQRRIVTPDSKIKQKREEQLENHSAITILPA